MALEGAPVLEPCDMHALLARREGPHPSLTLALDAPALAFCLTPCLPASLLAFYNSAHVSSVTSAFSNSGSLNSLPGGSGGAF